MWGLPATWPKWRQILDRNMLVKYYTYKPYHMFFSLHPELTGVERHLRNLPDDNNYHCGRADWATLRETYCSGSWLEKKEVPYFINFEFWNPLYSQRALQDKERLLSLLHPQLGCAWTGTVGLSLGEKPTHSLTQVTLSTPLPSCSR